MPAFRLAFAAQVIYVCETQFQGWRRNQQEKNTLSSGR